MSFKLCQLCTNGWRHAVDLGGGQVHLDPDFKREILALPPHFSKAPGQVLARPSSVAVPERADPQRVVRTSLLMRSFASWVA
jgi:hypothetical protein